MELKSSINESFLELFYKEIECDVPETHSRLNLHILKIENNQFCYPDLVKHLRNHFISFSLSRKVTYNLASE